MPSDLQRLREAVTAAIRYGTLQDLYDALDAYHAAVDAELERLRGRLIWAAEAADATSEILAKRFYHPTDLQLIEKLRKRAQGIRAALGEEARDA